MREPARGGERVEDFSREWLEAHLAAERRHTEVLGEIREAVFGAQDGLVSTLGVVATVAGATDDRFPVLVAGLASALAGIFSMGIGEYTSSKSQREIYQHEIEDEREEVRGRPAEAEAELAFLFERDGLDGERARRVATDIRTSEGATLRTMMEKEHGIIVEPGPGPLQGALVMAVAFGLGSFVPVLPFLLLPVPVATAVWWSVGLTGAVLFAIGAFKTRWTRRSPLASGLEIVVLAAAAAVAGYLFGTMLPAILGVAAPSG